MGCQDTYSQTKTFKYPNCTVNVHFPALTDDENERRMKLLQDAASDIIKEQLVVNKENQKVG